MAAPGVVGTASGERVGSGAITVTPPAGAAAYIAVADWYGSLTDMVPPTGWTLHTRGTVENPWSNWGLWVAGSSPGSGWTKNSTSQGGVVVVQGYDAAFTVDHAAGTNNSLTCPSVTTSVIARILRLWTSQPFNSTPTVGYPSSATDGRFTEIITNGIEHWVVAISSVAQTATGSTGTAAYTLSGATNFGSRAHTLAISSAGSTNLVVADLTTTGALDAVTLTQVHALTAGDLTVTATPDATALTQAHSLTVADLTVAGTLDALAVTQTHQVTAEDLTVTTALDGASLTQVHTLTAADLTVAGSLDAVALEQAHALDVADLTISTTLDPVTLTTAGDLAAADLTIATTLDHVALTQAHDLAAADLQASGLLDHVELSTATVLLVDDLLVATALDAATLTQGHALTAGDLTLTLTLDGVTLGQDHQLATADLLITTSLDGVGTFPADFTVAVHPRASIAGNTARAAVLEPAGTATLPGSTHRATITTSTTRAEMT